MNSSIALAVFLGNVVPQLISGGGIRWEQDYAAAKVAAIRDQKPLAVFVGRGPSGWIQLVREKTWDPAIRRILTTGYVAVYLNQEIDANRKLAQAMGLSDRPGLVISDRGGSLMAYRHVGPMSAVELAIQLTRYTDPNLVVQTTQGHGAPFRSQTPVAAPVVYQNAYFNPATCHT